MIVTGADLFGFHTELLSTETVAVIPITRLTNCPFIDYIILGEGEEQLLDLVRCLRTGTPLLDKIENGIAFRTFKARLKRGWSGERAATEGTRDIAHNPDDEWEVTALENGLSVRAYRARVQAGCPEAIAATMGLSWRKW